MTQTKAESVIAAVVAADYPATVSQLQDGSWTVLVQAKGYTLDSAVVQNFVVSNGVTGTSNMVLLT